MQRTTIVVGEGFVNLRLLWQTWYGNQILSALGFGQLTNQKGLRTLRKAFKASGLKLNVKKKSQGLKEVRGVRISKALQFAVLNQGPKWGTEDG